MKKLLICLALAGCAGITTEPQPQAARLTADQLTVTMTDAKVCRADWRAAGGAGRLEACGLDYAATLDPNPNILHQWAQELALALNATSAFPPMAEVVLTNAAGRSFRFTSPPPAPLD